MFNSLASYILGNGNRNATDITRDDNKTTGATEEHAINNFKFVSTSAEDDVDDDWLLIEKRDGDSTPQQTDSEEEIPFIEIKNAPAIRTRHSRNNSYVGSQDGAFSLLPSSPVPNSMDESWYVTPPPCFISTDPVHVEISPLENLLIEHPSMSVYHLRGVLSSNDGTATGTEVETVEETDDQDDMILIDLSTLTADRPLSVAAYEMHHPASERNSGQTMRVARDRAEDHVSHMTVQQVKQAISVKHSQKAHERKNRQQIARNAIERGNKVREVNGKGGRQKRSDMTHCKVISRANNNRKC